MNFGEYLTYLRLECTRPMREISQMTRISELKWNAFETGLRYPPGTAEEVYCMLEALNVAEGSAQYHRLMDLAALENGLLPWDIAEDEELVQILAPVMGALRRRRLSEIELERFLGTVRNASDESTRRKAGEGARAFIMRRARPEDSEETGAVPTGIRRLSRRR